MARLIILVVTEGEGVKVEFDGTFQPWESVAALEEAIRNIADREEQDSKGD